MIPGKKTSKNEKSRATCAARERVCVHACVCVCLCGLSQRWDGVGWRWGGGGVGWDVVCGRAKLTIREDDAL